MPTFAESIDAEKLPCVLGVLARQVDASTDAISRLKSLLALYETFLRLLAGVGVGILRTQLQIVPDDLARILVARLSGPTWDDWHRVAQRCAPRLAPGSSVDLQAALDRLRSLTQDFQKCRNDDGHAPVSQWAQSKYDEFAPRVVQALGALPWLASLSLEVDVATQRFPIGRQMELAPAAKNSNDAFVVARLPDASEISLYPFFVVVDRGPLVGVYTSLTDSWKELRVVGLGELAEAPHPQKQKKHLELARFRAWCRYEDRARLLGELEDFDDEVAKARRIFGRKQDLQDIVSAVATNAVVFVEGVAGAGKSHVMRHLVTRLKNDRYRVVYWRFSESDAVRSSRLPFLKHLALKLGQWYGPDGEKGAPRIDIDPSAWERVILEMLRSPAEPVQATVVVVDGLDECNDPWLTGLPFTFNIAGLHWVCSGRPTVELQRIFSASTCHRHQLKALTPVDVTEWITAEAPAFVTRAQEVAQSSGGLPEYLRRLLDDSNAATAVGVALPAGISEFLKDTIDRSRKTCSVRAMRVYVQVLHATAISVEPLDARMLGALLQPGRAATENTAIDESLRALAPLLHSFERDGRTFFQPPHALLKEMLTGDPDFRDDLDEVVSKYSTLASAPPSDSYVAEWIPRAGLRQLIANGQVDQALRLGCDFGWIVRTLFGGVENKLVGASEEAKSTRRERLGRFVETLDLLLRSAPANSDGSKVASVLRVIRAFPEALIEDGDQLLFQLLANGEAGPEWREGARSWLRNQSTVSWVGWLELVASTQPATFESLDLELHMPTDVTNAVFEPDGEHIIAVHPNEHASRWDLRTSRCVARIAELRGTLLGFASDGDLYALDGEQLTRWRSTPNGLLKHDARPLPGTYRASWRLSDGSIAIALQTSEEALVVRADDQTVLVKVRLSQPYNVACAVTKDAILLSESEDDSPVYTEVDTGQRSPCEVKSFLVDTARNTVLVAPPLGKRIQVYDLDTFETSHTLDVVGATWSTFYWAAAGPNTDGVSALSTFDGDLVIYQSEGHAVRVVSKVHTGSFGVAVAPTGLRVATWAQEGNQVIRVWNVDPNRAAAPESCGTPERSDSPAFALAIPNGSETVLCLRGRHAELRNFSDGRLLEQRHAGVRAVASVARNGKWIAAIDDQSDDEVHIFDACTGEKHWLCDSELGDVEELFLDDDGLVLEVHHSDGETTFWMVPERRRIGEGDLPPSNALGRHFDIDRDPSSFRYYADNFEATSRRVRFYDWERDKGRAMSSAFRAQRYEYPIHASAVWWARSRITYAVAASDGRVAVAVEDGSIYFLRFHTRVPVEPHIVR